MAKKKVVLLQCYTENIDNNTSTSLLEHSIIISCLSITCLSSKGQLPATISYLHLQCCSQLTTLSSSGLLQQRLCVLNIISNPKLESIAERFHNNMSLESIAFHRCDNLKYILASLHSLSCLRCFTLRNCPAIVSFPEGLLNTNLCVSFQDWLWLSGDIPLDWWMFGCRVFSTGKKWECGCLACLSNLSDNQKIPKTEVPIRRGFPKSYLSRSRKEDSLNFLECFRSKLKYKYQKSSMSVNEFVLKLKKYSKSLAVAGQPQTEDELISQILGGLGAEYDAVVVTITARQGSITLQEVEFLLMSCESRLAQHNVASIEIGNASANFSSHNFGNSGGMRGNSFRGRSRGRGRGRGGGRFGSKIVSQLCVKNGHMVSSCYRGLTNLFKVFNTISEPRWSISGTLSSDVSSIF
ncbi:hypothetical protein EZV62_003494 [Acer yangbiense]|uniref:Uncharacterized protein n=1 Tax=Acer yangbiense TaxID=1000413 RepID=A0A5C7IHL1_9ROSI|nr:hypothetical protein EZV62_003494 [Acer yangbiense]